MVDPRAEKVADILVNHSARVQEGDNVYLVTNSLEALPWFVAVRNKVIQNGAFPHEHVLFDSQSCGMWSMDHDWMAYASDHQLKTLSTVKLAEVAAMDARIGIGGETNTKWLADIDPARIALRRRVTRPILERVLPTRWVSTKYPAAAFAREAGMSTEAFADLVYASIVDVDWSEQKRLNRQVKTVFDNANEVRIVGEDTELSFSLAGRVGRCDDGEHNMPGGEVFYAPIHTSVRGHITYSYPTIHYGNEVDGIYLEFNGNGRIRTATADRGQAFLENMIATDDGAHYIGEFGIGNNAKINRYVKNLLFDEKMGGTVHLAIGYAYEETVTPEDPHGRNQSAIHWDLVKDLNPLAGGGEIIVDGRVVQKDGEWRFL
jgi:aminopeptidase